MFDAPAKGCSGSWDHVLSQYQPQNIAEAVTYMNLKWEVARTGGEGWGKLQAATQNARDKKHGCF